MALSPFARGAEHVSVLFDLLPQAHVESVQARLGVIAQEASLFEEGGKSSQLRPVKTHPSPCDTKMLLPRSESFEDFSQRHFDALDFE